MRNGGSGGPCQRRLTFVTVRRAVAPDPIRSHSLKACCPKPVIYSEPVGADGAVIGVAVASNCKAVSSLARSSTNILTLPAK